MALIGNTYAAHQRSSLVFRTMLLKTSPKQPFLDTKSVRETARWLETACNPFVVMRLSSPVVLSNLDAGLEPRCPSKDF